MRAVVVYLLVLAVVVLAWGALPVWRRLTSRAVTRTHKVTPADHGVTFCEHCGVQPLGDESSCRACGTPLYLSSLTARRGA